MSRGEGSRIRAGLVCTVAVVAVSLVVPAAAGSASGSPFAWRGVIQAGYGPFFSHRERVRLIRFMGAHGFNAYVHAPKGDPYQRTLWRDPYPATKQYRFDQEVDLAHRRGITWIPNVSPGIASYPTPGPTPEGTSPSEPLCFSCPDDEQALLAKLAPFRQAGVRTFMVSFDDVQREFAYPQDVQAYGSGDQAYGRANGDLLTRLYQALRAADPGARLLTVAADYDGTADSLYLLGLRETLAPGIEVMWTGPDVQSRPFSAAEADAYAGLIGRTPIVWENWLANDTIRRPGKPPRRIFLGPFNRRAGLAGHVGGFFFHTANEAELNFLPLATAGDWMRRPRHYRPRRAFLASVREIGGRLAVPLRAFAETSYSTTLRPKVEAPTFWRLAHRFLDARRARGDGADAAARLRRELRLAAGAGRRLRSADRLLPLVREAGPFLRSARFAAEAAIIATDLLQARRSARGLLRAQLRLASARSRALAQETYGSRSGLFGLSGNLVDRYVHAVRRLDGAR